MPELPEVETIRQQLERKIRNKKIKKAEVRFAKILNIPAKSFVNKVKRKVFTTIGRRAKLLLLELSNKSYLVVHLKMTGRLLYVDKKVKPSKHTHIIFYLNSHKLFFEDYRKFGYIKYVENKDELEKLLAKERFGPEILDSNFTLEKFKKLLAKKSKLTIKPLLMDQTFIAGVGNVYAQEACFYAKIDPRRKVQTLTEKEIEALFESLRKVLVLALKYKGSSVDAYLDIYGKPGKFVPLLKVYGREGKPCFRCKTKIKAIKLGGRTTCYCPKCQK